MKRNGHVVCRTKSVAPVFVMAAIASVLAMQRWSIASESDREVVLLRRSANLVRHIVRTHIFHHRFGHRKPPKGTY